MNGWVWQVCARRARWGADRRVWQGAGLARCRSAPAGRGPVGMPGRRAESRVAVGGQEAGGFAGVPHSAQNFAVADRLALQFVQCFWVAVPHSGQNFDPAWT